MANIYLNSAKKKEIKNEKNLERKQILEIKAELINSC